MAAINLQQTTVSSLFSKYNPVKTREASRCSNGGRCRSRSYGPLESADRSLLTQVYKQQAGSLLVFAVEPEVSS